LKPWRCSYLTPSPGGTPCIIAPQPRPTPTVLSDAVAAHLFARASALDAAGGRAGATVTQLRAAAAEAGISDRAFDAALAELPGAGQARDPEVSGWPRRRLRIWALAVGTAAVIAAGVLAVTQRQASTGAAPMVEEAFLLRCLSPAEAAELVRPLLRLPTNSVVYSAARAPRVLAIRATPAQIQTVRSVLGQYERTASPVCAPAPVPTVTP
jgi:hypothetical protein